MQPGAHRVNKRGWVIAQTTPHKMEWAFGGIWMTNGKNGQYRFGLQQLKQMGGGVIEHKQCMNGSTGNSIITLLLEVDVVLLPIPGVGQVCRVCLCLAGEECVLRYVYSYVLGWCNDKWWPWGKQKKWSWVLFMKICYSSPNSLYKDHCHPSVRPSKQ